MFSATCHYPLRGLLVLSFVVGTFVFLVPGLSQEPSAKVKIQRVPARDTREINGAKLYRSYCAACHGVSGKGDGPAAPALKATASDLTLLSKLNGGKFPTHHVQQVLSSQAEYAAHGSRDMPVWGPVFGSLGDRDRAAAELRVHNLTRYLESIQVK